MKFMKYIKTYEKLQLGSQKELDSTLLIYCKVKESLQLIRNLIIKGANVNCRDRIFSRTPLIVASSTGWVGGIKLLIEKGADINAMDYDGNTALMFIGSRYNIGSGLKNVIDLFIQKEVDLNHTNNSGKDAFHVLVNSYLEKYIQEKYPEKYEDYLIKKEANKYNL